VSYEDPDFWTSCQQSILFLLVILFIELRNLELGTSRATSAYARAPGRRPVSIIAGFLGVVALLFPLAMVSLCSLVLGGYVQPTDGWAYFAALAVVSSCLGAGIGLLPLAMKSN
jgi:hypothetical protein